MANSDNLIPNSERSPTELRKMAANGGKKSGEVRRTKKTMREMLDYLLEKDITTNKGDISTMEAIMVSMIAKASKGDVRAAEFIRDTIGQKPDANSNVRLELTQALVRFIDGSDSGNTK